MWLNIWIRIAGKCPVETVHILIFFLVYLYNSKNISFYPPRGMLLGKTTVLSQLYIQPFFQGYPPFKDLATLYRDSVKFSMLAEQDIRPLFQGDVGQVVVNVVKNMPQYLGAMSSITFQLSNVQTNGSSKYNRGDAAAVSSHFAELSDHFDEISEQPEQNIAEITGK